MDFFGHVTGLSMDNLYSNSIAQNTNLLFAEK